MSGSTFNNTGDFRGANVFQDSTLTNVGQIIGTMTTASASDRESLRKLIKELQAVLSTVPATAVAKSNEVAENASTLVSEAVKEKSNPTILRAVGKALVNAAKGIAMHAPTALGIAEKVVGLIGKIKGL